MATLLRPGLLAPMSDALEQSGGSQTSLDSLIFEIRGQAVMLDRDLASLYGVETRVLNQAVDRNPGRFPEDFSFVLTRQEIMRISQIVISSQLKYSKRVTVFTEQGIAMLSSVLRGERAIAVNVAIMRTFVRLRAAISSAALLSHQVAELKQRMDLHDKEILAIFDVIERLVQSPTSQKQIGFHAEHGEAGPPSP